MKALKCLIKIRSPLQDVALRNQLFTKVSDRIVAEAPNLKTLEFLFVFSAHRKTFLTEIRSANTKHHAIYTKARLAVRDAIKHLYDDDKGDYF